MIALELTDEDFRREAARRGVVVVDDAWTGQPEPGWGERMRAWRVRQGLTQVEAARLARCDPQTWHRWETERLCPNIDALARIAAKRPGAHVAIWYR